MGYLAPAGTIISATDILRGFGRGLFPAEAQNLLSDQLCRKLPVEYCWPVASGRAAMSLILQAMRIAVRDPSRDEVIIPAYTCYSVPAAVARAGLRPRLCDIDPRTLAMDPEALERAEFGRVLAIVSANLYGIPDTLDAYEAIARHRGVFMLDDAAQALGARLTGRAVGTFGDAGLISFDKGKVICTIQGGAVVSRSGPVAGALRDRLSDVSAAPWSETFLNGMKLLMYALFLRPGLYGVIRKLPFLGLGRTEYETRFPIAGLGGIQAGLAATLISRLASIQAERLNNAWGLAASLADLPGISLIDVPPGAEPVYTRFPIRVVRPALRESIMDRLDRAGIGATVSYPAALPDVPEVAALLRTRVGSFTGAREVASQLLTLPTHGYCPPNLGAQVRRVIGGILSDRPDWA